MFEHPLIRYFFSGKLIIKTIFPPEDIYYIKQSTRTFTSIKNKKKNVTHFVTQVDWLENNYF